MINDLNAIIFSYYKSESCLHLKKSLILPACHGTWSLATAIMQNWHVEGISYPFEELSEERKNREDIPSRPRGICVSFFSE
jgi:hypothetical protein